MNIKSIVEPLLKYRIKGSPLYHEGINKISILDQDLENISKKDCNNLLTILLAKMYIVDNYTPMNEPLLKDIRVVFTNLDGFLNSTDETTNPLEELTMNTREEATHPLDELVKSASEEIINPLEELVKSSSEETASPLEGSVKSASVSASATPRTANSLDASTRSSTTTTRPYLSPSMRYLSLYDSRGDSAVQSSLNNQQIDELAASILRM